MRAKIKDLFLPGKRFAPLAVAAAWMIAFAISYAQSPLFTSNQNQYFLHGLARAGYGFLADDWLANTRDPTLLFSWLVEWTWRLFENGTAFYLYYALLMGVYLFSLAGIADAIFKVRETRLKYGVFLAGMVGIHSALARQALADGIGESWRYLLEGGLAGQRLLGDVLEPSSFGVFLLLSICLFLRGKPYWAVAAIGVAASFHPTYMLGGALLTISYGVVHLIETKNIRQTIATGVLALALVAPNLLYATTVFTPSDAEVYVDMQAELVTFRIPHHAIVTEWFGVSAAAQIGIMLLGLWLARRSRLFWVLAVPALAAIALTAAQLLTGSNALALLFPWRVSVMLVPIATTLMLSFGLTRLWARFGGRLEQNAKVVRGTLAVMVVALMATGIVRFRLEAEQKYSGPQAEMMAYVRENLVEGQRFIIPVSLDDFRLATGAPVAVDRKSIAYLDTELAVWLTRVHNVNRFYREDNQRGNCRHLRILAEEFGATHVVLPQRDFLIDCKNTEEIYNNGAFAIRRILIEVR
jgi:hypothetical protein